MKIAQSIFLVSDFCKMAPTIAQRKPLLLLKMLQNSRRRRSSMQKLIVLWQRRRQLLIRLAFLTALLVSSWDNKTTLQSRSSRRLMRNTVWIDQALSAYSDGRFKKTFRISRATFKYILGKIETRLLRQTITEVPISPACRLAICLYRLGRGDYFYTISELAGCGRSTVCGIVNEVTQAIV